MTIAKERKAEAIALLLEGNTAGYVAEKLGLSRTTVYTWQMADTRLLPNVREEIGALVLAHLTSNLESLGAIADHVKDKTWLMKQDAQQLAVLYGVMSDKTSRVLEAMNSNPLATPTLEGGDDVVEGDTK